MGAAQFHRQTGRWVHGAKPRGATSSQEAQLAIRSQGTSVWAIPTGKVPVGDKVVWGLVGIILVMRELPRRMV